MMSIYGSEHSKACDRDTDLFFEIADVLQFTPEQYSQVSWGEFAPTVGQQQDMIESLAADGVQAFDARSYRGDEDIRWLTVQDCGTVMCVAGHAANLRGWFPTLAYEGRELNWASVSQEEGDHEDIGSDVSRVARDLLGITDEEADILFSGSGAWEPDDLRAMGKGADIINYE